MRVKKYYGLLAIIGSILILTGCGESFPDLTDEQYNQTVEYAVVLLMKYSNNGQSRLVYIDAKEEQKNRERQARKEAKEAENEQTESKQTTPAPAAPSQVEPAPVESTEYPSEEENNENVMTGEDLASAGEENSATDTGGDTGSDAPKHPEAITLSSEQSQEISPDLFLSYQGYSVSSTYPESSKSYVVNADKGKKLLVLRFDLYNGSDSAKDVNMIKYNLLFQVLLNDKNIGYTSVTFLPNDLSSYVGTIDSRAHESLVVLTQIGENEATNIESLGMIVAEGDEEQTVYLK